MMADMKAACIEALDRNIKNGFITVGDAYRTVYARGIINLIESLAAELEQVKQERDGLQLELDELKEEYYTDIHTARDPMMDKIKQLERERDAAVEDVAKLKRCEHCIGYEEFLKIDGNIERCNACEERSHWQWRGVKEG